MPLPFGAEPARDGFVWVSPGHVGVLAVGFGALSPGHVGVLALGFGVLSPGHLGVISVAFGALALGVASPCDFGLVVMYVCGCLASALRASAAAGLFGSKRGGSVCFLT